MPRYHVHVYRVARMHQVDIDARDEKQARAAALEAVKQHKTKDEEPDCRLIALAFRLTRARRV